MEGSKNRLLKMSFCCQFLVKFVAQNFDYFFMFLDTPILQDSPLNTIWQLVILIGVIIINSTQKGFRTIFTVYNGNFLQN